MTGYRLCAFSEYWKIVDEMSLNLNNYQLWIDPIHKRNGIIYSDELNIHILENQKYFSSFVFEYNDLIISLFILHCKSQIRSNIDPFRITQNVCTIINEKIREYNTEYIIILGDFNLPHYTELFLNSFLFNTLNYFDTNSNPYKIIEGDKYLKFYSPISALAGDLSRGPLGSYYYTSRTSSQSWNVFDQALISYPLSSYLVKEKIEILSEIAGANLLNNNRKPNTNFSDHMPIKIELL